MFDFQKYRNNQPFTERFDPECLGRVMRLKDEPKPVAIIADLPRDSMAMELAIAASLKRKMDIVVIGESSGVGVSLHDDDLLKALEPVKIEPLDIKQLFGRNGSQR